MLEIAFYLGMYTTHFGVDNSELNEDNRIIAVQVEDVVVGRMKNSFYNESYFAAYNYQFNDWSGVLLGAVNAYDYDCMLTGCSREEMGNSDILPVFAPYVHWKGVHALVQGNAISVLYKIDL